MFINNNFKPKILSFNFKNKLFLSILFLILFFIPSLFAVEDGFDFISFNSNFTSEKSLLIYEFTYHGDFNENDLFKIDFYFNGSFEKTFCNQILNYEEGFVFERKSCEIENLGDGFYQFNAYILRDGLVYKNLYTSHYISKNNYIEMSFEDLNGETKVNLFVESQYENFILYQDIPSSVISTLTYENRDNYINSELPFLIIEENPLIAWNLDSPPRNVSYTIKKEISPEEKLEFKVSIGEDRNYSILRFIVFILFLIVLILIFKPLFNKKAKHKNV